MRVTGASDRGCWGCRYLKAEFAAMGVELRSERGLRMDEHYLDVCRYALDDAADRGTRAG